MPLTMWAFELESIQPCIPSAIMQEQLAPCYIDCGPLITVLSFTMILTVYGRMFSLWMYAAIAPIPLSTLFRGNPPAAWQSRKNFIRSYAGVCLQGVVIFAE